MLKLVSWFCVIGIVSVLSGIGCEFDRQSRKPSPVIEQRLDENLFGIWVTRWDYRTKEDIQEIVRRASAMGITDLYWQVRGQADAYYPSSIDTWGEELTRPVPELGPDGKKIKPIVEPIRELDPGFDPLGEAVTQAHRSGLRIHAWMNVMPLWRGKIAPMDKGHLLHTHPQWRLHDENGKAQPLGDGYVVVNPVLDEVQDYIVRVVEDVVKRYRVDGVHLDYIRFLTDELGKEKLYPGDAKSLSLYARMEGDRATAGQINRTKYRGWIRDRITHLVERIHDESLESRPGIEFSAAVWRNPDIAREQYLQDAAKWVNSGAVDLVMPMIYTEKDSLYETDIQEWSVQAPRERVIPGIGVYKHKRGSQTLSQVALGHPRRFALFAYGSLFESVNPDQDRSEEAIAQRSEMRGSITEFIERIGR